MLRMMRWRSRSAALFTLFITCAVLLSGCFHLDRGMKLNGDGSGSYTLTVGLNEALVGLAGDKITKSMDESGRQVKAKGGDYRHFDQDGYSVWVFTRPFKSVDELNTLLHENPASSSANAGDSAGLPAQTQDTLAVTETPGIFVNSFHMAGHISMKDLSGASSGGSGIDMSSYLKDARESVSITMPGWVTSHGPGAEVQGNTVTYTVHYNEEATIDVVGGGVNPTAISLAAGAGLLVLLLIGGVIVWRRRQRRQRAAEPALVPAGVASGDMPTIPMSSAPDQTPTP